MYGVCLPLAVLIGYLLAEPQDSGSQAVLTLVICVLSVPLVMRWHYPMLVFSCNAWIAFSFLPGHPPLWMLLAFASLSLSMLNRSLGQRLSFFRARAVSYSLLFICFVALATAFLTEGIGFRFLGGSNFGGKKYAFLFAAVMLYFALATQPIPRSRANLYVGLFFLSSLVPLISYVGAMLGPGFYFLAEFFPMQTAVENVEAAASAGSGFTGNDINRFTDLTAVATGVLCYLMARQGARGLMDLRRPWRLAIFLGATATGLYSGSRSCFVLFPLVFAVMFLLERLYRTRYMTFLIAALVVGTAVLVPNVARLPLSVQRALSILPLNIDPVAKEDAKGSTTWRVEMWKQLLPDIPKYLIKGRGYALNPEDLFLVSQAASRGQASPYEVSLVAGDFHSGPLSVIIPFGLGGVIAFLWFLGASLYTLYSNFRYGDPYLYRINIFLFAYFIVQIIIFFFVFGSLYSDLLTFAGLVGMSVSLNGGVATPKQIEPELAEEEEGE